MGTKDTNGNGDGLRAMNILQLIMLAGIIGLGTWMVSSIQAQGKAIMEMQYQLRDSSRARWGIGHQVEYNVQLGTLNATLRTPDVRKIAKENEP